jgi:diamine N-acetyltransferase
LGGGERYTTVSRDSRVELREVTAENLQAVLNLRVSDSQQRYVASNAKSIAEAHFHPEAWFRAIFAGEVPVGFLMLHDENLRSQPRQEDFYFLWRLMVDAGYQKLGFGRRAVEILIAHVRGRPNAHRLLTSCHPGEGSPEGFYHRLGFRPTGRDLGEEVELALCLQADDLKRRCS